jgi:hypothetical protein
MEELRGLATKHELALVVIHHSMKKPPKRKEGFAVFDAMLGTTGIGTVVDVGIVLEDTSCDGEVVARFATRNSDTPSDLAMKLDRDGLTGWHVTNGVEQARKGRELSRIQQAIVDIVQTADTPLTPMGIVAAAKDGATKLNYSSVKVNCRRLVQRGVLCGENGSYRKVVKSGETVVTAPVSLCVSAISEGYDLGLQEVAVESDVTEPAADGGDPVDNTIPAASVLTEVSEAVSKSPTGEVAPPALPLPLSKRIHAVLKEEDRNMTVDVLAERLREDATLQAAAIEAPQQAEATSPADSPAAAGESLTTPPAAEAPQTAPEDQEPAQESEQHAALATKRAVLDSRIANLLSEYSGGARISIIVNRVGADRDQVLAALEGMVERKIVRARPPCDVVKEWSYSVAA